MLSESIVLKTSWKEHKRELFTTRKIPCIEEGMNKQLHLSLVKKCPEFSQEFLHFATFFPFWTVEVLACEKAFVYIFNTVSKYIPAVCLPFSTNSFSVTDKLPPPTADETAGCVRDSPMVDFAGDLRGLFGDFLLLWKLILLLQLVKWVVITLNT